MKYETMIQSISKLADPMNSNPTIEQLRDTLASLCPDSRVGQATSLSIEASRF